MLAFVLRVAFLASGRGRVAPVVMLVVAALVLLAAYGLSRPRGPAPAPLAPAGQEGSR